MTHEPDFFPIQSLTFDPELQIRVRIDDERIVQYAECMTTEEEMQAFPPVEIFYDGLKYWLADGHHRRAAAEKAGHSKIWAIIKSGTHDDALWAAIIANGKQGFGLTREDKKRAIEIAVKKWPKKSNRVLALAVGCDERTIRRIRENSSGAANAAPEKDEIVVGKDGKSYPANQKKQSSKNSETLESSQPQETGEADLESTPEVPKPVVLDFPGEKPGFAPGSEEEEKYSPHTQLKPIPRNRPDVLVRNLLSHLPKEFVPNMIRATFQIFVEIGEKKQAKELATEIYKTFARK